MADGSPPNPQPLPDEPWLEALTSDQVAQLVHEVSPEVFYLRASAFDQAGGRLQDVLDQIRHEMNTVREVWHGTASDDFDELVRGVTGKVTGVLQFLQNPGYGATLRDAGDRLADHQRRMRDLDGQKAQLANQPPEAGGPTPEMIQQAGDDSAKQILRDLRTAYWDVGNGLPGFPYKPPSKEVGDPNTVTTGDGGQSNGHPGPENQHGGNDGHVNGNGPGFVPPPSRANLSGDGPVHFGPNQETNPSYGPGATGDDRFAFIDSGGQNGFGDQTLGRTDHSGPGWSGHGGQEFPGGPAWLGQTAFAGGASVPEVLGQKKQRQKVTGPVENRPDVELPGAPAVLGRTGFGPPVEVPPGRTAGKRKEEKKKVVERPAPPMTDERAEVSNEIRDTPAPRPVAIRTTTDVPAPAPVPQHEVAAPTAGISVTPQGTPVPAPAPQLGDVVLPDPPEFALKGDLPLDLNGSHGGVVQAMNPQTRALHAVGPTATPDSFQGNAPASPDTGAVPPGPPMRPDQFGGGQLGGGGGFPMMGGMGGGMGGGTGMSPGGRMASMPNEPRPDVWDPLTGSLGVVGRRAPEPEPKDVKDPNGPELSKEEIQARLAEKFAELDRLTKRRNDGGD